MSNLSWSAVILPHGNESHEHAVRTTSTWLAESTKHGQLIICHSHVSLATQTNHGLLLTSLMASSDNRVLTATGFVNGIKSFSTPAPQNRHPLTDH